MFFFLLFIEYLLCVVSFYRVCVLFLSVVYRTMVRNNCIKLVFYTSCLGFSVSWMSSLPLFLFRFPLPPTSSLCLSLSIFPISLEIGIDQSCRFVFIICIGFGICLHVQCFFHFKNSVDYNHTIVKHGKMPIANHCCYRFVLCIRYSLSSRIFSSLSLSIHWEYFWGNNFHTLGLFSTEKTPSLLELI